MKIIFMLIFVVLLSGCSKKDNIPIDALNDCMENLEHKLVAPSTLNIQSV